MKPEKANHDHIRKLTDLPNIGRATVKDLHAIGINTPEELKGHDPFALFDTLCATTGKKHDPCTLDILISAIRFLDGEDARPWWAYSDERKARLALNDHEASSKFEDTSIQADEAGGEEGTNPDASTAKNGLIDYIELPCRDLAQTEEFFRNVFNWTFTAYGEQYTAFSGAGINGGFYLSQQVSHSANGSALIVIYDANLFAAQARIVDAGGYINQPIFSFPGGQRFHFIDPNGNEWAVWSDRHS